MTEYKLGDYYRHKDTGDLWQIKELDGVVKIVRDLPNQQIWMQISQLHKFAKETNARKMLPGQLARVAFEADAALCSVHTELPRNKHWLDLDGKDKQKWIDGKVDFKDSIRKELYVAVMRVLLDHNKD